jgi:hypothetical protein
LIGGPLLAGFFEGFRVIAPRVFLLPAVALAIALVPLNCRPSVPDPVGPISVRDVDLLTVYRDDPRKASLAYDGQPIRLFVQAFAIVGETMEIPIAFGKPAAIILRFGGPVPDAHSPIWVSGHCNGRVNDGIDRMTPGFTFHIEVSDCVISP